ncbi:hypothetical protein CTAM01_03722 [Colletotrichum tamarilloi]|uniref:Uncharacterized protein n=1 Tax=Colletotrichum tamarilloi TaxID=1209934 RepID=A0ABQ9RKI6_9PEZI|nr:uncharacterized protein CTAM01_03722 [Colletotrichum tamarilloi]KAK1506387.1 hypothetical protein CTAM01_03722 [Colletotrichum tamarilloi]
MRRAAFYDGHRRPHAVDNISCSARLRGRLLQTIEEMK